MTSPLRVGIIGPGTLGTALDRHLSAQPRAVEIVGFLARKTGVRHRGTAPCYTTLSDLLAQHPTVIVECAGQAALAQYGREILGAGVHLVPASVGALVDDGLRRSLLDAAMANHSQLRLPSGAIAGIDGLAAARHGGVDKVLYRGTMSPASLQRYVDEPLPEQGLVFSGPARVAVSKFPKNANLTGTIALAGIGFDETQVEMHTDPTVDSNIHELIVQGDFGHFHVKVSGRRISDTSSTSRIVAGSLAEAALGSAFLNLSNT